MVAGCRCFFVGFQLPLTSPQVSFFKMALNIRDAPGVDVFFTDGSEADRRWGYFYTFAHPVSDTLEGWEGEPKKPASFSREEFWALLVRCYEEAYPNGPKVRSDVLARA